MPHLDLATYLSDDTLILDGVASDRYPQGKSYSIKSPSAVDGLRLQRIVAAGALTPSEQAESGALEELTEFCKDADGNTISLDQKLLGAAHAEMLADNVSSDRLSRIVRVVLTHYGLGAEVAGRVVAAAGEAAAPTAGAANSRPRSTGGKPRTRPATAGSASTSGRTGTRAPAPARTSTRSSSKPPPKSAAKTAKAS